VLPGYNGKDRTFWSFNYEGVRQTEESVSQAFWFPEEFRRGDFSALLTPLIRDGRPVRAPIIIHDPLTGEPFRNSQGQISNIIPASRINQNAQKFFNTYMPLPQFRPDDILDINVIASVPSFLEQNQYFARVDHNFSASDRIFVRYAGQRTTYDNRQLNPNFRTIFSMRPHNIAAQYLHLFGSRVMNEFRFGYNRLTTISSIRVPIRISTWIRSASGSSVWPLTTTESSSRSSRPSHQPAFCRATAALVSTSTTPTRSRIIFPSSRRTTTSSSEWSTGG
jgi:hypothetical protein